MAEHGRKKTVFLISLGVALTIAAILWFLRADNAICSAGPKQSIPSPDGLYTAEISYVDCGGTSTRDLVISINNTKQDRNYGTIFSAINRPNPVTVSWPNPTTLKITGFSLDDLLQLNRSRAGEIKINLEPKEGDGVGPINPKGT